MSALLEIDDLVVEFRSDGGQARALRGLSLRVEEGRSVGLVGESGCGKTVGMLAVLGLLPDNAVVTGEIRYRGVPVATPAEVVALRGHPVAMVFQDAMRSLNPLVPVGAQVAEALRRHRGMTRRQARTAAIDLLDRVRLRNPAALYRRYPHELSGGMRQRVMIAAALACGPELLIADESTTGLDVTVQAQILELLHDLQADEGISIVFVSHDLGAVAQLCDDLWVIYGGRTVEHGPTAEVLAHPVHPYTAALLAALPELGRRRPLAGIEGLPPSAYDDLQGCSFEPRCPHALGRCKLEAPTLVALDEHHTVECWAASPATVRSSVSSPGHG